MSILLKNVQILILLVVFSVTIGQVAVPVYAADQTPDSSNQLLQNSDGTVTDSKTGLMWADSDNGKNINWKKAKLFCEEFSVGGHSDWRLPAVNELAGLHEAGIRRGSGSISLSGYFVWASETRKSKASFFRFNNGRQGWDSKHNSRPTRVLPVRDIKQF